MAQQLAPTNQLRRRVVTIAVAMSIGLLGVPLTAAGAATPNASSAACTVDGTNATVHFTLTPSAAAPKAQITALRISGLSTSGCAHPLPVMVTIKGTPSGDPAGTTTETLTVLHSTTDPCTGDPLARPTYVTGGAITLTACPTGGPGGYADVHDATRLVVRVAGRQVAIGTSDGHLPGAGPGTAVLGEKITHVAPRPAAKPGRSRVAGLAFTGGWIGRLLGAAVLALLAGALLLALSAERRRRSPG